MTDPPYGLSEHSVADVRKCLAAWLLGERHDHGKAGFMGNAWDGWVPGPDVWAQCYRVLRPGGHLLAFAGSRTADLMGIAIRLGVPEGCAGWRAKPWFAWLYGQGAGFSHVWTPPTEQQRARNASLTAEDDAMVEAGWGGWSRGWAKPAYEPVLAFQKPCNGPVSRNVLERGVGAVNIDGCRVAVTESGGRELIVQSSEIDAPGKAVYGQGVSVGSRAAGTTQTGRFPPTVLLSHLPECKPAGVAMVKKPGGVTPRPAPTDNTVYRDGLGGGDQFGHYNENGMEAAAVWECAPGCPSAAVGEQSGEAGGHGGGYAGHGKMRHVYGGGLVGGEAIPGKEAWGTGTASRFFPQSTWEHERWECVPGCPVADVRAHGEACGAHAAGHTKSPDCVASEESVVYGEGIGGYVFRHGDAGGVDRFFPQFTPDADEPPFLYHPKAATSEREAGLGDASGARVNRHPTIKPIGLIRWLVRFVLPPGGVLLDPFAGTGSTLIAGILEGAGLALGCELLPAADGDLDHVGLARRRVAWWAEHGEDAVKKWKATTADGREEASDDD